MSSPTIADALHRHLADRPPHVSSKEEAHIWASEALACSRQIAYRLMSDPDAQREYSLATHVIFRVGEALHDSTQAAVLAQPDQFPGARIEVPWDLGHVSGRADGTYEGPDGPVVVEIKSMSDWSFKAALKKDLFGQKVLAGTPKPEHVMQASLGTRALGSRWVHVFYLNKSTRPDGPATVEWLLPVDDDAVDMELDRMQGIVDAVKERRVPEPFYDGDIILRPAQTKWPCGYCPWLERCLADGPDEVQL